MRVWSSIASEIIDLKRFWEILRAYVVILLLTFIPYKFLSDKGFEMSQVRLVSGIFFSVFLFGYLCVFDTRLFLFRRLAVGLLNLGTKYRVVLYVMLVGLMVLAVSSIHGGQDAAVSSIDGSQDARRIADPLVIPFILVPTLIGLHLGILFTSNNLSRIWLKGSLPTTFLLILFLFFILSAMHLYAGPRQDMLIRLSSLILAGTFFLTHIYIKLRVRRLSIIEANWLDLQVSSSGKPATRYYNWIRDGRLLWACFHFAAHRYVFLNLLMHLKKEDQYKVSARIRYRLGWYEAVLRLLRRAERKRIGSDVLVSLKGLSYLQLGDIDRALEIFCAAFHKDSKKPLEKRNPYFAFNLGYLLWAKSEPGENLQEAVRYTEETLRINPQCAMAHNNLACLKAEQARLKYKSNRKEFRRLLDEASESAKIAFEYVEEYYYSTLRDTKAYIAMLRKDYQTAKEELLKTAPVDTDSRIHLALILMTESEIYDKSECYLKRVLSILRKKPWHRNYKLATHLLNLISSARRKKAFNEEILFYFDQLNIPSSAYAPAKHDRRLGEIRISYGFLPSVLSLRLLRPPILRKHRAN
jgi:tetratricopeptide (TPR) repeat protein